MGRLYLMRYAAAGAALVFSLLTAGAWAQSNSQANAATPTAFVDGIAAVVNKQVITLQQLNSEVAVARRELTRQGAPLPDDASLQDEVLENMIMRELQRQEAERLDIEVTQEDVDSALETIMERNQLSREGLRKEVEASGLDWERYLRDLRQDIRLNMLRQRAVDNTIFVSDVEVDTFLRTEGRQLDSAAPSSSAGGEAHSIGASASPSASSLFELAQILVEVPEGASSGQRQQLRDKAQALLARVRGGDDFAQVAAASSDASNAQEGGDLGIRPLDGWPDLFVHAIQGLSQGDVTDIIESGNGFHILKLVSVQQDARGLPEHTAAQPSPSSSGARLVTQTHARHILIKTSQVVSDEDAQERLQRLRERVAHGESFEDLAKRYSEDPSAPQGGDLGWLTPGETVPAFEQAMDALSAGQVSAPVHSPFGWHLIQVLERRDKDMGDEFRRMQARQILFERRVEPALEDWLSQLRGQAYIDKRIDTQTTSR